MKKVAFTEKQKSLLESLGVGAVLLFGSSVKGTRHPGSDVDIGVAFRDFGAKERDPVHIYGTLQELFAALLPKEDLDIVYLHEAPLALRFRAISEGEVLYFAPSFYADYRERVMLKYFDFLPVEREFTRAFAGTL